MTAEKNKEVKAPEETKEAAAALEPTKSEEKKPERKLETSYLERGLKDGTVFLKRKKGKPRPRKIVSKKGQAQLYFYDRGTWTQKTALTQVGAIHGLKWHLRHKWIKIEEKDLPKPPGPKKAKAPEEVKESAA